MISYGRIGLLAILFGFFASIAFAEEKTDLKTNDIETVQYLAQQLFGNNREKRLEALKALTARGRLDVTPILIQALRFVPSHADVNKALVSLVGHQYGPSWHKWMLWLESHPEIKPFEGFDRVKADVMAQIDENFRLFLRPGIKHEIRLEEIAWGGVRKDGIPSLNNPKLIKAEEASYLNDDELVFGVAINGDVRAYPLRIMDWHEMFNDVIGGVPVALAYCTLCGSGILFETKIPSQPDPLIFGSSGFLYRSNKLMYDQQTHSLWNQFTGKPVVGPLVGSKIQLKVRPVIITIWKQWRKRHPESKVLSLDTGYNREYTTLSPYWDYFEGPDLMFPALITNKRLNPKDYVFALRATVGEKANSNEKAWPLSLFKGGAVINDKVGDLDVVLIGEAKTRTVRAYKAKGHEFKAGVTADQIKDEKEHIWTIEEDALIGENSKRLERLPGHVAYWFAWQGFKPDKANLQ
ncbi:MAG: DUF3179 domain-containing protein [Rhodospirillales bacterium]|nr:DUF3179 domain-containing protein [Rhodospirillales bacterium]